MRRSTPHSLGRSGSSDGRRWHVECRRGSKQAPLASGADDQSPHAANFLVGGGSAVPLAGPLSQYRAPVSRKRPCYRFKGLVFAVIIHFRTIHPEVIPRPTPGANGPRNRFFARQMATFCVRSAPASPGARCIRLGTAVHTGIRSRHSEPETCVRAELAIPGGWGC
eukprot:gene8393-biopygen9160